MSDFNITLNQEEYKRLLIMMGYAISAAFKENRDMAYRFLELANRVNSDNPQWRKYPIPDDAGDMPKLWLIRSATLPMILRLGDDGLFVGEFPALPGCASQGKTYDDAVLNLAKAIVALLQEKNVEVVQ